MKKCFREDLSRISSCSEVLQEFLQKLLNLFQKFFKVFLQEFSKKFFQAFYEESLRKFIFFIGKLDTSIHILYIFEKIPRSSSGISTRSSYKLYEEHLQKMLRNSLRGSFSNCSRRFFWSVFRSSSNYSFQEFLWMIAGDTNHTPYGRRPCTVITVPYRTVHDENDVREKSFFRSTSRSSSKEIFQGFSLWVPTEVSARVSPLLVLKFL